MSEETLEEHEKHCGCGNYPMLEKTFENKGNWFDGYNNTQDEASKKGLAEYHLGQDASPVKIKSMVGLDKFGKPMKCCIQHTNSVCDYHYGLWMGKAQIKADVLKILREGCPIRLIDNSICGNEFLCKSCLLKIKRIEGLA